MNDAFYMSSNTVIMNYSAAYFSTPKDVLSSDGFKMFLSRYLKDLAVRDIKTFNWVTKGHDLDEMVAEIVKVAKTLLVLELDEIDNPMVNSPINRAKALYMVEDAYNYWRRFMRFSVVRSSTSESLAFNSFIEADTLYNNAALELYRSLEEKLQGKSNYVYRQLQAGTLASAVIQKYKWNIFKGYECLQNVEFIKTVMLRTPIILHPASNKRYGIFEETDVNPIRKSGVNTKEWLCFPCKVGNLLCFCYFHRDYMANGISLANLFELANEEECLNRKPDIMVLFGNENEEAGNNKFYYDEANDLWVGSIAHDWKIEYFGYIKKIILTLHNLAKMQHASLPIHGSMLNIYLSNGTKKGVCMMGDSGAGKSETLEVLKYLSEKDEGELKIERTEVVFDDMGSFTIKDGVVMANGTEIGAYVRLDDLDKSTAYRDMERSIFVNPEILNSRVIVPASSYELISSDHKVDILLYANNYDDMIGVHRFTDYSDAKQTFVEGKRMALGTTSEKGLSKTYFANPFGPMQRQDVCEPIMGMVFDKLFNDGIYVGEIYTNLGTPHKENIEESAKQLLALIKTL